MLSVQLEITEWNQVLSMLATQPWHAANPIIMKLGEQLRQQQQLAANPELLNPLQGVKTNSSAGTKPQ